MILVPKKLNTFNLSATQRYEGYTALASWNKCRFCIRSPIPSFHGRPHHTAIISIFHQCSRALISDHHKLCDEDVEPIHKGNCSLHGYCSWRGRGYFSNPLSAETFSLGLGGLRWGCNWFFGWFVLACSRALHVIIDSVIVLCLLCGGGTSSTAGLKCGGS